MNYNSYTSDEYRKAFTELCFFLDEFDDSELNKIPSKELDYYYNNRDTSYKFECDLDKPIENIEMMHLTEILLVNIYEKYLSEDDEKKILSKRRKNYYNQIELEKNQKYDVDIFKKKIEKKEAESTQMTVKKEGIIKRIITKLINIFKIREN